MLVHMHSVTAENVDERDAYWPLLAQNIQEHEVDILAGDFNMAMTDVIPGLKRCGVDASVAAWYPWKTQTGDLAADSCAIFFVRAHAVGRFKLTYPLELIHRDDEKGLLFRPDFMSEDEMKRVDAEMTNGELDHYPWPFHRHVFNGGPGELVKSYCPRTKVTTPAADKLRQLLSPLPASLAAVAAYDEAKAQGRAPPP